MRELRFERDLDVAPEEAWRWLTEPELMNRWSEAKVAPTGDHTRRVTVRAFGVTSRLEEEIVERDPPKRFVYRVLRHPTIRDHRGVIEITARGESSRVVWTVRFRGVVPGLELILAAILEPALARSLDALVGELQR